MATKGTVGQLLVEMRADLGKLRVDVKEMEGIFKSSFSNVQNLAKSFGSILAASFSAGAIIAYGKQIVDLGGRLKDLSQQTGISGQTLSGLKSTLEESGTSLDAFAKGIFTVQKNLGGIKNESDPAAQAVKALGLNLDELRQADTDKFLELITDALGNVSNPLNRAQLGAQLLGKSFRELGPAIEQIAGRLAELKAGGISEEDIEILDRWGDSWTRISNTIEVFLAGQMSRLIEDLDNIGRSLQRGVLYWRRFWASATFSDVGDLNSQIEELLSPQSHTPAKEPGARFKPPVDEAALKKTADEMKRLIEGIQKSNAALQAQVIELNYGKEAAQNYTLAQQEMEENSKGISTALKREQDRRRELTDQLRLETQAREDLAALSKAWVKDIDDMTAAQEKWADIKMDAETLGLDDLSKALDEISRKYTDLIVKAQAAAEAAGASPEEIEAVTRRFLTARAREQAQARAGFTGEGVDAEAEAKARADQFGADLANSLTSGMRNTLLGIETGQQTLGEGMKNLVRNMLLELQGAVFDKGVLEPLKAIAAGFISGFVGALDDAANKDLKKWAEGLGESLKEWLGTGLTSIFGSFSFGGGEGVAGGSAGLVGGMGYARGGMIPSFAKGGLFIGHGGEFVMQKKAVDSIGADTLAAANQSGKLPGGGATAVTVEINGDITPRQPNMTPDQVVRVTAGNITNDGMVMSAIENRLRMRGR